MMDIDNQPTSAAAGMVRIHAQRMLVANPQRTAFRRWIEPTPAMAPAVTCVVETGRCAYSVANRIEIAAAVSAQNPLRGFRRVRREPMVCTIRQPPESVPSAMAVYAEKMTQ